MRYLNSDIFDTCFRGSCKESKECGSGVCTFMRCRCHAGFVGPNCLVSHVDSVIVEIRDVLYCIVLYCIVSEMQGRQGGVGKGRAKGRIA
jgi:hypothetical protein